TGGLDLAADLPEPPAGRPHPVLAVEQRDEPPGGDEQAVQGERVTVRQGPPGPERAQVGGEAGAGFLHRHRAGGPRRVRLGLPAPSLARGTALRPAESGRPPAGFRRVSTLVQPHADLPEPRASALARLARTGGQAITGSAAGSGRSGGRRAVIVCYQPGR